MAKQWHQVFKEISPSVVKIESPGSQGTGFVCLRTDRFVGIATAYHVLQYADYWQQPIRVIHQSGTILLKEEERFILSGTDGRDSAILLFEEPSDLDFPQKLVQLLSPEKYPKVGVEVGWIGFPGAILSDNLCFFSGNISARIDSSYFIDGVAINGVSGGLVIHKTNSAVIGTISAYIYNRATGEALPGLSVAEDVSNLHQIASEIKNLDEARAQQQTPAPPQGPAPGPAPLQGPAPGPAPPPGSALGPI